MSVEGSPPAKPPRKILAWAAGAVALLLVLAVAWTALWRFAAGESEKTIEAWIAREKSFGRIWSCPDRTVEGYPFAIEIACARPRFEGMIFGRHLAGGLSELRATAVVFRPHRVAVALIAPLALLSDDRKTNLELTWEDLEVMLDGLPQPIWRVAINGRKLGLHGTLEELGTLAGAADRFSADAAQNRDQADSAYDFTVAVNHAALPDLDRLLGAALPAEINAQGTLTKAGFDPDLSLSENIEHWRLAGGRLDLIGASLKHGDTRIAARGSLTLDKLHRLKGKLDTESHGFEALLLRLGVNPMLVSAGTLLNSIITSAAPGEQTSADTLVVAVGFDAGRVSIGPVRTSIYLLPLY